MVLMARYPDNYFDLAIVDPPYGINISKTGILGNSSFAKKNGIMQYLQKNILTNYLEFLKIKLFGVVIILQNF